MQEQINNLPKLAKDKHKENRAFFTKLSKKPPKQLDYIMQDLHDKEFERTDCLKCANCCKTTGPLFTDKDVSRIAKHFKMKEHKFVHFWVQIIIALYTKCVPKLVENFRIQTEKSFNKFLILR